MSSINSFIICHLLKLTANPYLTHNMLNSFFINSSNSTPVCRYSIFFSTVLLNFGKAPVGFFHWLCLFWLTSIFVSSWSRHISSHRCCAKLCSGTYLQQMSQYSYASRRLFSNHVTDARPNLRQKKVWVIMKSRVFRASGGPYSLIGLVWDISTYTHFIWNSWPWSKNKTKPPKIAYMHTENLIFPVTSDISIKFTESMTQWEHFRITQDNRVQWNLPTKKIKLQQFLLLIPKQKSELLIGVQMCIN